LLGSSLEEEQWATVSARTVPLKLHRLLAFLLSKKNKKNQDTATAIPLLLIHDPTELPLEGPRAQPRTITKQYIPTPAKMAIVGQTNNSYTLTHETKSPLFP
jgi:hypothetical protein